jgi:hypothetical protein
MAAASTRFTTWFLGWNDGRCRLQPPGTPRFPRGVGACCKCPEGNQCILHMDAGHPANRCWIVRNSPACQKKTGGLGKFGSVYGGGPRSRLQLRLGLQRRLRFWLWLRLRLRLRLCRFCMNVRQICTHMFFLLCMYVYCSCMYMHVFVCTYISVYTCASMCNESTCAMYPFTVYVLYEGMYICIYVSDIINKYQHPSKYHYNSSTLITNHRNIIKYDQH